MRGAFRSTSRSVKSRPLLSPAGSLSTSALATVCQSLPSSHAAAELRPAPREDMWLPCLPPVLQVDTLCAMDEQSRPEEPEEVAPSREGAAAAGVRQNLAYRVCRGGGTQGLRSAVSAALAEMMAALCWLLCWGFHTTAKQISVMFARFAGAAAEG